ncbi:phytase [Emcibacter sp.]|uniref:phytase n=1 Tax=Emcibacter sp. TaxID=1979954 RepID=UPI002AA7A72D|nr:phytase [Emcibacter sp.]
MTKFTHGSAAVIALLMAACAQQPEEETGTAVKVSVTADMETPAVETEGDAADDMAIWVNPADPEKSRIIGTQKKSGLYVYDLKGEIVQFLPDGRMNNVDLRDGFDLAGKQVTIVASTNRTDLSISLYAIDPETMELYDVANGVQATGFEDPYGLCMYHSAVDGSFYIFANDKDFGDYKQWRLVATPEGKIQLEVAREFTVGDQTEGCVADDTTGELYIGEENTGIWKYVAEPTSDEHRQLIRLIDNNSLTADVEGLALYHTKGGKGYLVASSQGSNSYALFDRDNNYDYVGSFKVVDDPEKGIDGAQETDGLEALSTPLPGYPQGVFMAQDGFNTLPKENQNFKLVDWRKISDALKLRP